MFSGRRSALSPSGAPLATPASAKTGVEVSSDKTKNLGGAISGHVAGFSRGKSKPGWLQDRQLHDRPRRSPSQSDQRAGDCDSTFVASESGVRSSPRRFSSGSM